MAFVGMIFIIAALVSIPLSVLVIGNDTEISRQKEYGYVDELDMDWTDPEKVFYDMEITGCRNMPDAKLWDYRKEKTEKKVPIIYEKIGNVA